MLLYATARGIPEIIQPSDENTGLTPFIGTVQGRDDEGLSGGGAWMHPFGGLP